MKNKTFEKLLKLLPIVANKGWRETKSGHIRDKNGRCPVCSVVNEIDPKIKSKLDAWSSWKDLTGSFDSYEIDQIIWAADFKDDAEYARLRKKLMLALGMKND